MIKQLHEMKNVRIITKGVLALPVFLFFLKGNTQSIGPEKIHSFMLGVSDVSIIDDNVELNLNGIRTGGVDYSFSAASGYRKKSISVSWKNGRVGGFKLTDIRAEYAAAFSVIKNKDSRFNTYLGYSITTNPVFITKIQEAKQYSWTTSTNLSAYCSAVYGWKNNSISFDLSIPVAGFASRPENNNGYGSNMNELLYESYNNLFFTSFHNLKAALLSVQYARPITKRINLQTGYQYSYRQLDESYGFRQVSHGLWAGVYYRLK
jgi:hypothetical protein